MEMDTTNQQQSPPQPPVNNQIPNNVPSHPKSRMILLLVAALLIFAVAGIGAYYLGARNNQSTPQPIQQTSYPSPTTLQPTPNIDETTNWKTYSNGQVTFKYPPDMDVNEPEKDFIMIVSKETKVVPQGVAYKITISIDLRSSQRTIDYDKIINNLKGKFYNTQITPIKNKDGVIISGKIAPDDPNNHVIAYLKYKNSAVAVNYLGDSDKQNVFEEILQTIEFTQ